MDLISIIVPVYKVEKYLDRCVESIVNQTYKNLEIILVDDGSPDNCPAMCDEWAKKDGRIKVIHKENGGLSDARNAGMKIATGKFIGFVDSDDYISSEMYEDLYNNLTENDSDISVCGVEMFWDDGTRKPLTVEGSGLFSNKEAIKENICGKKITNIVVNKLYKTTNIKNIHFKVGKQHEDVAWTYLALAKARKVSVFDKKLYYYFQNSNSIMGSAYSVKRFDAFDALYDKYLFMKKNYPEFASVALKSYCGALRYNYQYIARLSDFDNEKKYRKIIFEKFSEVYSKELYYNISLKEKIWLLLFKINPDIGVWLRNILKIGL